MSDDTPKSFDWRTVLVTAALIVGQGLIQWGITSTTLVDHARRIDTLERRFEERSIAREEYERRHEDLTRQVQELKGEVRELERKAR